MAAEAEAAREARAKIIRAHGEEKATKALKQAADELAHNPHAIQLRYLQTLSSIGNEKNTTIIFPVPVDMISHFVGRNGSSTGQKQSSRLSSTSSSSKPLPPQSHQQQQQQQQQQSPQQSSVSLQKTSSVPCVQVVIPDEENRYEDFLLRKTNV